MRERKGTWDLPWIMKVTEIITSPWLSLRACAIWDARYCRLANHPGN